MSGPANVFRWTERVLEGRTTIDESMVTGEPIPVEKEAGAQVTGGTVNGTGTFVMNAERVGADTLLAQIVRMVSEAQRSRAPIQRLADTVSGYFVPAVIVVAIATFAIWSRMRSRTTSRARAGECGCGPDHRVPLRARLGHPDVDHGRDRPRCRGRRADTERRSTRDS